MSLNKNPEPVFGETFSRKLFEHLVENGNIILPKDCKVDDFHFKTLDKIKLNFLPSTKELSIEVVCAVESKENDIMNLSFTPLQKSI